jgi:hypothetical protein
MRTISFGEWFTDLIAIFVPRGDPSVGVGQVKVRTIATDVLNLTSFSYLRRIRLGLKLYQDKLYCIKA